MGLNLKLGMSYFGFQRSRSEMWDFFSLSDINIDKPKPKMGLIGKIFKKSPKIDPIDKYIKEMIGTRVNMSIHLVFIGV